MLWSRASQEEIIKNLQAIKSTYGPAAYFLQTDSVYKTSRSQPKKYYLFRFVTYYANDLLRYEFMVVEEKEGFRMASMIYNAYKGNYNDPLMNYGTLTVPKVFINNILSGKMKEAYSLFSESLTESLSEENFEGMATTIADALGELQTIECMDTCTALNFYGDSESMGLFAMKLIGSKGNLYFNGTVSMTNDGTFFLTRFQLFEEAELNNLNEMKAAENAYRSFLFFVEHGSL